MIYSIIIPLLWSSTLLFIKKIKSRLFHWLFRLSHPEQQQQRRKKIRWFDFLIHSFQWIVLTLQTLLNAKNVVFLRWLVSLVHFKSWPCFWLTRRLMNLSESSIWWLEILEFYDSMWKKEKKRTTVNQINGHFYEAETSVVLLAFAQQIHICEHETLNGVMKLA